MATRGDMKGFFRQRKKSGGITKPPPNAKSSSSKKKLSNPDPNNSASFGSEIVQAPAIVSRGSLDLQDNYDDSNEEVLRQFDMNMAYGPCLGMSRLDRWERAAALGMNPPKDVERLLRGSKVRSQCLWDGRV